MPEIIQIELTRDELIAVLCAIESADGSRVDSEPLRHAEIILDEALLGVIGDATVEPS